MSRSLRLCQLCIAVICIALAAPSFAEAKFSLFGSKKKDTSAADHQKEKLTKELHAFGKKVAASYNRCVMPSKAKKHVVKNKNGTYTAEYMEIDTNSIGGSYRNSSNPKGPVKYIGSLYYSEVKYTCTAKTKAGALKGPFSAHRTNTTELVKYMNGKWTY